MSQITDPDSATESVATQPANLSTVRPWSVSVIIPTKNRPADLERTVNSLLGQTVLPRQLIIVDQSATDESLKVVTRQFNQASPQVQEMVRLCYTLDPGIPGGAVARNRAMDLAEGEIWLFLDDDVILEPDFLRQILAVYVRYPQAVGVSGVVTNYQLPPFSLRLWNRVFARGPFHDDRQPVYWRANRGWTGDPVRVTRLGAGLMSFRAQAIRKLRFDESLRGVSDGEDVDFCVRLGRGPLLMMAPRARLIHNQSPAGRGQDHWLRRHARAQYFLHWRNWNAGRWAQLLFAWLNVGYGLTATWGSIRKLSLQPWMAFLAGVRDAREVLRWGSARLPSLSPQGPQKAGCGKSSSLLSNRSS